MYKVAYDGSTETTVHKVVFAKTMEDIAKSDEKVVYLDADLMNSSGTYKFWKGNPKQAINCGIAEANMMGVAGGLSAVGLKPYAHTFGPFASRRCYDQVFISIAYAGNSVRIYGSDPGVCAAFNGGTHMPFEDMALMRAVPEATVLDLADGIQFDWVLRHVADRKGLTYMRSTRKSYKKIYEEGSAFEIGKANLVREGDDITVIAAGLMVGEAMEAAKELSQEGISVRVVDMFTVKPLDLEMVVRCAKETGAVVTSENHNIIGGLGDAVASALLESGVPCAFKKHGVEDRFGQVGPQDYLQEVYGLTAARLKEVIRETLSKKVR